MNESEKKLFAIIGKYLDEVKGNNKKTTEICHIGKFIMLLNESVSIFRLSESPDCLLNTNQGIIGLEHQIIVNKSLREQEGCFETIIRSVEQNLLADSSIPNFFANCDILPVIFGQNHRFASSGLRARPRNSAYRRKPPPRNSISPHASTEPMSMLQRTIFTPLGAEIFDFTVPSPCRSCLTEITPYGVGKVPSAHCRPPR